MNRSQETAAMLARQAAWQKARRRLPWPIKIRMAETMREAALSLRKNPAGVRVRQPDTDRT